jgi:two-component system, LuxR family, sensor kinase FixL
MRALFGFKEHEEIHFDDLMGRIHPDDRAHVMAEVERSQEIGAPFQAEYRAVLPDGTERWVLAKGRTMSSVAGDTHRVGVVLDITDRKQAEQALRESEQRFRAMANAAPVMIWISGTDGRCTFFNSRWLEFTGRKLTQELGHGWTENVHREDVDRCLAAYERAFAARQEFSTEYRLLRHDGEYRYIVDQGLPRFDGNGTFLGYIGTRIDMTERRQAEESVRQQQAFLRQVIDINPNFIFAKDREGRFTLANRTVADAYGVSVDKLIGKSDSDFNPNRNEVEFYRRVDLEVMDTLQERFIPEERITDAHGRTRWLQTVKRPLIGREGSATHVLGASTDITQRKKTEMELHVQRAELAHVARVSMMGELSASLAHELNQPLTAILANARAGLRFIAGEPPNLEELQGLLEDIVEANTRAAAIIRRVRGFVKKEQPEFAMLDIASLVCDVVALVHSDAIMQDIRIDLHLAEDLPPVSGDRIQLQQVVLNILLNAFDALKDSPAGQREVEIRAQRDASGMVRIAVRDNGPGFGPIGLDRIFQPFYTTKREGLGMGLSICRSIIVAHGGSLWAQNHPERGATFYFTLPPDRRTPVDHW